MIVLIATLFGVYDITTLMLIFVVNALINLFGLVMEQLNGNRKEKHWGPFIWGSIAGIATWVAIGMSMVATGNYGQIPWFVCQSPELILSPSIPFLLICFFNIIRSENGTIIFMEKECILY